MGRYINNIKDGTPLPVHGKAKFLIDKAGATHTDATFKEDLVCVVQNGLFDAA